VNLQQFIKQTLVQIIHGAIDAQDELIAKAHIYPVNMKLTDTENGDVALMPHREIQMVEFDVQLVVEESTEKTGNAGLGIKVFSAGINSQTSQNSQSTSRVKFSIPVLYDPH